MHNLKYILFHFLLCVIAKIRTLYIIDTNDYSDSFIILGIPVIDIALVSYLITALIFHFLSLKLLQKYILFSLFPVILGVLAVSSLGTASSYMTFAIYLILILPAVVGHVSAVAVVSFFRGAASSLKLRIIALVIMAPMLSLFLYQEYDHNRVKSCQVIRDVRNTFNHTSKTEMLSFVKNNLDELKKEPCGHYSYDPAPFLPVRNNDLATLNAFLQAGIDPNFRGSDDQGLLHEAVEENNIEITQHLLVHGADPNIKDEDGMTPLHIAA